VKNKEHLPELVKEESWLEVVADEINARKNRFSIVYHDIIQEFGTLSEFANSHHYYGVQYDTIRKGWIYREWAPKANQLFLAGDFNGWDRNTHPLKRNHRNDWEIFLPKKDYEGIFKHEGKLKVIVHGENGVHDRIPSYITKVHQDPDSLDFSGQIWMPEISFNWEDQNFNPFSNIQVPFIYECHVGMAQEEEKVGTYREFADKILPYIQKLGYNSIQMMAIMEHPYYGSFGYHVSNFLRLHPVLAHQKI
jgi:1,4-alpha-glucan branching enzyme